MKLKEFLDMEGIRTKSFARRCGVSQVTIRNITLGKPITLEIALTIEKETRGHVKCKDLAATDEWKNTKSRSKENVARKLIAENETQE